MLKLDRKVMQSLGFDFSKALEEFRAAKQAHRFTTGVPAPTAHPLVESALAAGGFEIVDSPGSSEPPSSGSQPTPPATPQMLLQQLEQMVVQARQIIRQMGA